MMRVFLFVALAAVSVACAATQVGANLDARFGEPRVQRRLVAELRPGEKDYWTDVEPILNGRCVVCHSCFDAPCQFKQEAPEGLDRGASKEKVYEPSRLLAAPLTRLFEDAPSTEAWRTKEFFPVLNERAQSPAANLEGSVLGRMLTLKREHPLPEVAELQDFDFRIDREQVCPTIEEFPKFTQEHPSWGMPYGLPALGDQETKVVFQWLEQGGRWKPRPALSLGEEQPIAEWERLLNQEDAKSQLVSRYIYEHLFLAHIHFADEKPTETPRFFELVRSRTPPGRAPERISTRRPFDPSVDRVYYRFELLPSTVLVKSHLPYRLDAARMARYRSLFFDAPFSVEKLPGYESHLAANPFAAFVQLPVTSRYQFLLDDAHFFLDGFIKGPVCHGQTALNVINDRFWIVFARPEDAATQADADFFAKHAADFALPAGEGSNTDVFVNWKKYSDKQKAHLKERASFANQRYSEAGVTLELLWDGDGTNPNAALTVLRHEDSATVVQGLVGAPPKTSWVLGYGILERIHYLLVAGFDVFGNVGHQISTRLYMDFLRMEAEMNFLAFLPKSVRAPLRDQWYEGAEGEARVYINASNAAFTADTGIAYTSMNPELEFYELLQKHLATVVSPHYRIDDDKSPQVLAMNGTFEKITGGPAQYFPPLSFLEVTGAESNYYTIVRDDWHTNITSLFFEENNRRPEQDRLTLTRRLLGAYPNAFFRVPSEKLAEFSGMVASMKSADDYKKLKASFGVRRTNPAFWSFSDRLHTYERSTEPLRGGVFDFNRLENR